MNLHHNFFNERSKDKFFAAISARIGFMIIRKSRKDVERIHKSGAVLAQTHEFLAPHVKAGVTTGHLDQLAEEFIRSKGGVPTFKGYRGFPATLCTSVNDMVVHGIPGDVELRDGDLLSIDCGVTLNGWISDSARSYVVGGSGNPTGQRLIDCAWRSLEAGIEHCYAGRRMGDVSAAIQQVVEAEGFSVIRRLVGHGVGRNLHEDPQIPNFGQPGTGIELEEGWVIAIEPMITAGHHEIREDPHDGWSIYTADGSLAAHVEHTIAITGDGPMVLTR